MFFKLQTIWRKLLSFHTTFCESHFYENKFPFQPRINELSKVILISDIAIQTEDKLSSAFIAVA